ncbi:MAG TPA: putative zinc-binding protein [Methanospirillum sp.]|uniref:putative zinc-binding protein n=1 Tax=Methanospirillum sp. TaxID=45200 RepID=UPI002CA07EFA|nr:putative zinc-binding protein [Methanospirillum sp.]HWQ63668.1 putative zinc-binding protein [Methanospirillum sp.]
MEYETIQIRKIEGACGLCEEYSEKNSTSPPKIAILSCEGACARGEVSRRAANLVAHSLAKEETVRICLGGAFTKNTGQRNLVRRAERCLAIEGCFVSCASRMMQGVLPDLNPEVILADTLYEESLPFGIDEVSDETFSAYARQVAEKVVTKYVHK